MTKAGSKGTLDEKLKTLHLDVAVADILEITPLLFVPYSLLTMNSSDLAVLILFDQGVSE